MRKLKFKHYKYKNNSYEVLGTINMKCPKTGDWKHAVLYKNKSAHFGTCCRSIEGFLNKFTGIDKSEYNKMQKRTYFKGKDDHENYQLDN